MGETAPLSNPLCHNYVCSLPALWEWREGKGGDGRRKCALFFFLIVSVKAGEELAIFVPSSLYEWDEWSLLRSSERELVRNLAAPWHLTAR